MEKDVVGYRFQPTEEELINHYLKNKNLGKSWLVDDVIREINICSYEPMCLPSLSMIKSKDLAWYFFSPKVYKSAKKTEMKRTTSSGFWEVTGKDRKIKDKRGKGVEIGFMKPLVYYQGRSPNGVRTLWAIHEYHITCLSDDQIKYVICKVIYKGEDRDILYGNNFNLSEPSHSLASDLNTDTVRAINTAPERRIVEHKFSDQEEVSPCEGFDPNRFLSFDSYNGWNIKYDEILSGLSYQETSSDPDSSKDLQTRESQRTCRPIPSKQEVKEGKFKATVATMVNTKKKGWFITEEAMKIKGKAPRYIYLMNMVISFMLLVALIGNMSYRFY